MHQGGGECCGPRGRSLGDGCVLWHSFLSWTSAFNRSQTNNRFLISVELDLPVLGSQINLFTPKITQVKYYYCSVESPVYCYFIILWFIVIYDWPVFIFLSWQGSLDLTYTLGCICQPCFTLHVLASQHSHCRLFYLGPVLWPLVYLASVSHIRHCNLISPLFVCSQYHYAFYWVKNKSPSILSYLFHFILLAVHILIFLVFSANLWSRHCYITSITKMIWVTQLCHCPKCLKVLKWGWTEACFSFDHRSLQVTLLG